MNLHLITVLGQADPGTVWDISYSFGSDIFVEPGHIWSPHLLHGKFPELSECPRGALLETRSMDRLVNVDDVSLVTPSLMAECPSSRHPSLWEPLCWAQVGKTEASIIILLTNSYC